MRPSAASTTQHDRASSWVARRYASLERIIPWSRPPLVTTYEGRGVGLKAGWGFLASSQVLGRITKSLRKRCVAITNGALTLATIGSQGHMPVIARCPLGIALLVVVSSMLTLAGTGQPGTERPGKVAQPERGKKGALTLVKLERDLKAAVHIEKLPPDLKPRPRAARTDDAVIVRDGCRAVQLSAVKAAPVKAADSAGARTLDPTSWFCAPRICPAIVGNLVVYRDNAHMTPAYSKFLAPLLANVVEPLVGAHERG